MKRFKVYDDDTAPFIPRFSRRYVVLDTLMLDGQGRPVAVLETNNINQAQDYCGKLNSPNQYSAPTE